MNEDAQSANANKVTLLVANLDSVYHTESLTALT